MKWAILVKSSEDRKETIYSREWRASHRQVSGQANAAQAGMKRMRRREDGVVVGDKC